jgi:hypothetical protein
VGRCDGQTQELACPNETMTKSLLFTGHALGEPASNRKAKPYARIAPGVHCSGEA